MKYEKDAELGFNIAIPETCMEAVEQLEMFLIADFGQPDWSQNFLREHFKVCKDAIKKIPNPLNENKLWDILVDLKEDKICIETAVSKVLQLSERSKIPEELIIISKKANVNKKQSLNRIISRQADYLKNKE